MRTNESPRAKSSAPSAGSGGLADGITGVVATGRPDAGSGGDIVAGGARIASLAADLAAGASALESAAVAVLTAASVAVGAVPRVGLAFSGWVLARRGTTLGEGREGSHCRRGWQLDRYLARLSSVRRIRENDRMRGFDFVAAAGN
jgi:hypothetical protein